MNQNKSFFSNAIHYLLFIVSFGLYNNKRQSFSNDNLKTHEHGFFQPSPFYHSSLPKRSTTTLLPGERKKKKAMRRMQKVNRKINYHLQKVVF